MIRLGVPGRVSGTAVGFVLLAVGTLLPGQVAAQPLRAVQELRIDGIREDLSYVLFVDAFIDGTIVVAQPQDHHLLFYSSGGKRLAAYGRQGAGPGEFQLVGYSHGFVGDTLWVLDNFRVNFVTSDGAHVRTSTFPRPVTNAATTELLGVGPAYPEAITPGGNWLVTRIFPPGLSIPPRWRERLGANERGYVWTTEKGWPNRLLASTPSNQAICGTAISELQNCPRLRSFAGPSGDPFIVVKPVPTKEGS